MLNQLFSIMAKLMKNKKDLNGSKYISSLSLLKNINNKLDTSIIDVVMIVDKLVVKNEVIDIINKVRLNVVK